MEEEKEMQSKLAALKDRFVTDGLAIVKKLKNARREKRKLWANKMEPELKDKLKQQQANKKTLKKKEEEVCGWVYSGW